MEKKLTNSGSLREPADKHSIYTIEVGTPWLRLAQGSTERTWQLVDDAKGLIPIVQAFRESIRTGQAPEMSRAEGLRDLEVVLKAYESMAQGVSLPL